MKNARGKKFLDDNSNHAAKIPQFMIPKGDVPVRVQEVYPPRYSFKYRWTNKRDFSTFNEKSGDLSLHDKNFDLTVDPRVFNASHV